MAKTLFERPSDAHVTTVKISLQLKFPFQTLGAISFNPLALGSRRGPKTPWAGEGQKPLKTKICFKLFSPRL